MPEIPEAARQWRGRGQVPPRERATAKAERSEAPLSRKFRDKGVQKERNGGADYHAARRELTARRSATNKTPSYWQQGGALFIQVAREAS